MKPINHILSTRSLRSEQLLNLELAGCKVTTHNYINKVIEIPDYVNKFSVRQNVIITSSTGLMAFLKIVNMFRLNKADYKIYCIEPVTAKLVREAGLVIAGTASNSSLLVQEILHHDKVSKVTYISGSLDKGRLSKQLIENKVDINTLVVYNTRFTPHVVNESYSVIIYFSPSAIDSFLSVNQLRDVPCFCIGSTTGTYASEKGYSHIYIPDKPTEEDLIRKVFNLLKGSIC